MDQFPSDIFFHARHASNVLRNIVRDTLCLRARFAPCTAYRIVGRGRSFAFISRKTMPASTEELIGMFENITADEPVLQSSSSCSREINSISPLLIRPREYCINFIKKEEKRSKKKLHISDVTISVARVGVWGAFLAAIEQLSI